MQLSQVRTEGNFKLLLLSDPGIGKTVFGTSLPGKTLVLDFDGKIDSAALFWRKYNPERLELIEVEQLAAGLELTPIQQLEKIMRDRLIPEQRTGKMSFDTLLVDSITTFSAACLAHIVRTNPGIKRTASAQGTQPGLQDYGILKREFQRVIPGLLGLPCNVIMLAHIATEKDEMTGQILRHSNMDGSFAKELPIYFKEVWRAFVKDGVRYAQTQSDGQYNCRSQIPGLPNPVRLDYSEIARFL